jgi:hypothetical protein
MSRGGFRYYHLILMGVFWLSWYCSASALVMLAVPERSLMRLLLLRVKIPAGVLVMGHGRNHRVELRIGRARWERSGWRLKRG